MKVTLLKAPHNAQRLRVDRNTLLRIGEEADVTKKIVEGLQNTEGVELEVVKEKATAKNKSEGE